MTRHLVTLLVPFLAACATTPPAGSPAQAAALRYRESFHASAGTAFVATLGRDELVAALDKARVLWLGDHHASSRLHAMQSELLEQLRRRGVRMAFVLEAVGTQDGPQVQQYLAGELSIEDLRKVMRKRWSGSWLDDTELDPFFYRSLLAFAKKHQIPVTPLEPTPRGTLADRDEAMAKVVQEAPSYRRMAIERLLETHDPVTMDEAAMFAAKRLPATDALFVVSALKSSPEGEGAYFAAYRGLAERHPADLAASYQQCLADGVMPAHRMNAIMSLGNVGELQRDTVRLAFDQDPSYRVKGVALLALASELPTAEFAPLFDTALADPGFLGAEFGPSDLGNALRNHALVRRGDSNFIARATTALLAVLPTGNDAVRTRLEATRREFVMR